MFRLIAIIIVIGMGYTVARPMLPELSRQASVAQARLQSTHIGVSQAQASNTPNQSVQTRFTSHNVKDWREFYPDKFDVSENTEGGK
jgi:hypothetical protein